MAAMAKRRDRMRMLREEKRKRVEAEAAMEKAEKEKAGGAEGESAVGGGQVDINAADAEVAIAMTASSSFSPPSDQAAAEASRLRFEALPAYIPDNYPDEWDVFCAIDLDLNGRLSGTELRCSLRRVGMEETAVRILSSMYNATTTGIYSKALNFAEFVEALQSCWATSRWGG